MYTLFALYIPFRELLFLPGLKHLSSSLQPHIVLSSPEVNSPSISIKLMWLRPIFIRYTCDILAMLLLVRRLVVCFLGLCCQTPALYYEVSDYRFISRDL